MLLVALGGCAGGGKAIDRSEASASESAGAAGAMQGSAVPISRPLPSVDANMPAPPSPDTAVCGDKTVDGREQCDDGNTTEQDGCDASCQLEAGFACSVTGAACHAAACGDSLRVGLEDCDDGNSNAGDGCDAICQLEANFACEPGKACRATVCGDDAVEGSEQCEDGNDRPYDGCFGCQSEPLCANGECVAVCGDAIEFPSEACDDGDTRSGDGCSNSCTVEPGFVCAALADAPPELLDVPIIYRDFRGVDEPALEDQNLAAGHPDFEREGGTDLGIVDTRLGDDKKPRYARATGSSPSTTGAENFHSWYNDDPRYNRTIVDKLTLLLQPDGAYVYQNIAFFPLDDRGFVAEGNELTPYFNNFHFTSELRYWFQYEGSEQLDFFGDDDVWVFVNGRLALDLGGLHPAQAGTVTLAAANAAEFGLQVGGIYEIAVFQAERHTDSSQYKLTLRGFKRERSACRSVCGDGIVTSDERCDDGKNDGSYDSCQSDCHGLGPHCGDGIVQAEEGEQCDDANRQPLDGCDNGCQAIILE